MHTHPTPESRSFLPWPALSAAFLLAALILSLPASAQSGAFRVSGTKILDPSGNEFVVKGTNINGYNSAWGGDTISHLNLVKNVWKFNAVRVYNRIDPNYNGYNKNKQYLYDVIDTYTAAGMVVIPEVHDRTGSFFTSTSTPSLNDLKAFWIDLANRYKNNSRVWFNIMNEPDSSGTAATTPQWDAMHREVISAIRGTGAQNIIVLDGDSWAQESGVFNNNNVLTANSAFLTYGPNLLTWHQSNWGNKNLVFSPHFYREWVWGDSKMEDFLTRCHNAGLAIVVGEYGSYTNNPTLEATYSMGRVAFPKQVGRIVWHWLGGDQNDLTTSGNGGGHHIDRTDGVKPGNLTALGSFVWDDNHAAPSGGGNLAVNGDFETGSLSPWTGTQAYISGVKRSGSHGGRIGTSGGAAGTIQQIVPVQPNTSYTVRAWIRMSATGSSATLGADGYGGSATASSVGGTSWTERTLTFTTGSSATSVRVYLTKPANSGQLGYLDDVTLTKN